MNQPHLLLSATQGEVNLKSTSGKGAAYIMCVMQHLWKPNKGSSKRVTIDVADSRFFKIIKTFQEISRIFNKIQYFSEKNRHKEAGSEMLIIFQGNNYTRIRQ